MSVDTGRRPAGPPPPGGRSGPRPPRYPRSVHDRVSFKPIAALLLILVLQLALFLLVRFNDLKLSDRAGIAQAIRAAGRIVLPTDIVAADAFVAFLGSAAARQVLKEFQTN